MKKHKVQLIQTYVFEYEVEAENRIQAETKAKEFYENYPYDDDFFACSAGNHEKDTFKIV